MTEPFSIEPARTAVLCMDYQSSIVSAYVKDQEIPGRAASILTAARNAAMTVIYVQVGFRPNFPEVNSRNALLSTIRNSPQRRQMFEGPGGAIHSSVAPQGDDIVVTKHRVSAFAGTDLDMILRTKEIDTLIMFGISTSGVVLSTVRHAADADYRLFVVKDCCVDQDAEVHACLTEKIFPRQATVITSGEFLAALKSIQ
jgi:nicotinamidase-related amidase